MKNSILPLLLILLTACGPELPPVSEAGSAAIRLNQLGYHPGATVQIVLAERPAKDEAMLVDAAGTTVYKELTIGDSLNWDLAGETVWPMEVELPAITGDYRIYVPEVGYSHSFTVAEDVLTAAFLGATKGFYYLRVSEELEEEHAGRWHRPLGHQDTAALFHPSTGLTGGTLSSPGGWYDAGDFGKYTVNGAFSLGQMLALAEDIDDPAGDQALNIPESGNGRDDLLDEIKVELDWLITMQDRDGGLFHKLTPLNFDAMVMPHETIHDRFVIGKGTAGTLDFAAAAAQASRIYAVHDNDYATNLLNLAKLAWSWAMRYPSVAFTNPYDVTTGQYGDDDFSAEWYWAAAELFLATGENEYRDYLTKNQPDLSFQAGESWTGFMETMGAMSLLRHPDKVPATIYNPLKTGLIRVADSLTLASVVNPYGQPITDFRWGSNSDILNADMIVAAAHQLAPKPEYLNMIHSSVDYIFGKNALGISFLTGFGDHTPQHIHHRQSAADGIDEPVPGLLSGGPNSGQQDKKDTKYPPNLKPMQSWVDQEPSYASNEICLNWNAPLVYVLGWLEGQE